MLDASFFFYQVLTSRSVEKNKIITAFVVLVELLQEQNWSWPQYVGINWGKKSEASPNEHDLNAQFFL